MVLSNIGWASKDENILKCLRQCFSYLKISQVIEDVSRYTTYYRHMSRGGWSFSTRDCGWIVSDCTAEALKAILLLRKSIDFIDLKVEISEDQLFNSVDLLLSLQNKDGGYATYENQQGSLYYEWFNSSEVFSKLV